MADSGSTGDEGVKDNVNEIEYSSQDHNNEGRNNLQSFIEPTGEEINPQAVIDSFEQNSFEQPYQNPMNMFNQMNSSDMNQLFSQQAALQVLAQQQALASLASGQSGQHQQQAGNPLQANQANLLLAAQLAQLQAAQQLTQLGWPMQNQMAAGQNQMADFSSLYGNLGQLGGQLGGLNLGLAQLAGLQGGDGSQLYQNPLLNQLNPWAQQAAPQKPKQNFNNYSQQGNTMTSPKSKRPQKMNVGAPGQNQAGDHKKSSFGMNTIESQLMDIIRQQEGQGGQGLQDTLNGESDDGGRYARKVFVGGLPPDIDEDEIQAAFRRYGPLIVDWPHKNESKSYFPPKGYAFLLFQDEVSVHQLVQVCVKEDDKLFTTISSPTIKDKAVQIRPWNLNDSDFVMDGSAPLDPRKTIFVGGVPRPLRAVELAIIMDRLYGSVCYAGIDTDPELKYPKGAGRVAFSSQQSYIAAISARFVQLQHGEIDKRVEVKPYVLDDQMCDECAGSRCGGKFAPFFCANVTCLQYYCETCWSGIHARPGREFHKPLVKESTYTRSNRQNQPTFGNVNLATNMSILPQ